MSKSNAVINLRKKIMFVYKLDRTNGIRKKERKKGKRAKMENVGMGI